MGLVGASAARRRHLIALVGGENQAVVAFDKTNGKEKWKCSNPREICYSPPVIIEAGGKRQLIVWFSEALYWIEPLNRQEY